MALLAACWLMIESIVIQDGFFRWYYMKIYMHPLVLFLCQLLLWLYLFFLWLLPPFQAFHRAFSTALVTFLKLFGSFLRNIMVSTSNSEHRDEIKNSLVNLELSRNSIYNPTPALSFSFKEQVDSQLKVLLALQEGKILGEEDDDFFHECDQEHVVELLDAKEEEEDIEIVDAVKMEKNLEFELQTVLIDQEDENSLASDDDEEEEEEEEEGIVNSDVENDVSSVQVRERDHHSPLSFQDSIITENQTHQDEVYNKYCERMRWYDILSGDRTYALKTASSLSLWGKTAEKRLKQSIKKDLELVYVAQSCLSWEALQHQYITVRDSSKPADSKGVFYNDDISREFQNFQVLLERFLEDERCEGKRVLSFVQRRLEFMSFFQVPRLSGSYNREGPCEGENERKDKKVLKAIKKCIEVFYDFVKVDIKKPLIWEKLKISFVNSPLMELEDPRDFKLFLDLKISLQKKEQLMKEMQGNKKNSWLQKKSCNIQEDDIEKDETFVLVRFIMIDLKLVSRVLHMSLVSSSHLKWCQDKLNNIHFNGGKISRTSSPVLFPSS